MVTKDVPERDPVRHVRAHQPKGAEQRRGDRDRAVRRGQDQAVRLLERTLRRQEWHARIASRQEEQRDGLVHERDHIQDPDVEERREDDESRAQDVAGDHDRPAGLAIGDHPADRRREDRGHQPQHQDHGHGGLVVGEAVGGGDERERGDPVAKG